MVIFNSYVKLPEGKRKAGHILRSNNSDPLRRIGYDPNSAVNYHVWKRRVWGPRQQWLSYTSRSAWEKMTGTFEHTLEQNHKWFQLARSRQF